MSPGIPSPFGPHSEHWGYPRGTRGEEPSRSTETACGEELKGGDFPETPILHQPLGAGSQAWARVLAQGLADCVALDKFPHLSESRLHHL